VDLEVLHEVVTPTKVFSTGGDDTFVGFFVGVDGPDVSFEVLPSEETLAASMDVTSEHSGLWRWASAELISLHLGRNPAASTLLDEIGNGNWGFLVLVEVHVWVGRIVVGRMTGHRSDGTGKVRIGHEVWLGG
jgi:hypothetical protein